MNCRGCGGSGYVDHTEVCPVCKGSGKHAGAPTIEEALAVIQALVDEEPCRSDHEGFCQAHGCSRPCVVAPARGLLVRAL